MYIRFIRALSEPFSPAEVIEIKTDRCVSSCAGRGEREIVPPERVTRPSSLTVPAKQKR